MDAGKVTRWPLAWQVLYSEALEALEAVEGLSTEDCRALAKEAVLRAVGRQLRGPGGEGGAQVSAGHG